MTWWWLLAGIGGLLALSDDAPGSGSSGHLVTFGGAAVPFPPARSEDLTRWLEHAGLPPDWRLFFRLVAERESNFRISAKNPRPGEAEAARIAYERNKAWIDKCGHPATWYTWGSGGWFGLLPATAVANLPDRCTDPLTAIFSPAHSIAAAVGFARGLMGWSGFKKSPTFLNLRIGWGAPGAMGKPSALESKFPAFAKDAAQAGVPAALLGQVPSPLPTPATVLATLQAWAGAGANA